MARKGIDVFSDLQSLLRLQWRRGRLIWAIVGALLCVGFSFVWGYPVAGEQPQPTAVVAQSAGATAEGLLQDGRILFQSGQVKEAIAKWQQAVQLSESQGDRATQAISLSNLALAHQRLGDWTNAKTAIAASLAIVNQSPIPAPIRAQVLNTQGTLQFAAGQFNAALASWQQATSDYTTAQDRYGMALSQLNQAQVLTALGAHRRANELLGSLYQNRSSIPESLHLTILLNYGDNLRLLGQLANPINTPLGLISNPNSDIKLDLSSDIHSEGVLQQGLRLAQAKQSPDEVASALVSLGNTARAQHQLQATRYADRPDQLSRIYQQELLYSQQLLSSNDADVQQIAAWLREQTAIVAKPLLTPDQLGQVQALATRIEQKIRLIAVTRPTVFARLQLAENLIAATIGTSAMIPMESITPILDAAAQNAEILGDFQIQSYALWRKFYYQALYYYQKAAEVAPLTSLNSLHALLNQQSLLLTDIAEQRDSHSRSQALRLSPAIRDRLQQLPLSHQGLYDQIRFAQNLMELGSNSDFDLAQQWLQKTAEQAAQLSDLQAQSYALGYLGSIYEKQQQFQSAQRLTQEALALAQALKTANIAYLWQWQLGRLLKAQGDIQGAISAYTESVNSLNSIRQNLATINTGNADVQFSFRLNAEPVYMELVELLLKPNATTSSDQALEKARSVIESLQVAELENFFQEACVPAPTKIEGIDQTAAIIYPIVLPDRLDIIISLYDENVPKRVRLKQYSLPVKAEDIDQVTNQFRQALIPSAPLSDRLIYGQKLYQWMIKPLETDLQRSGIKTLVFIMNGNLRNVPMSALYDGTQFLIQKYQVALTPGLQLIVPEFLERQKLNALIAGLTEARQGFPALPSVESEVEKIHAMVSSQIILNEQLTNANLGQSLNQSSFNTIHLATHGQFSSNADQTFILTWDQKLNVKQFDALLRNSGTTQTTPIDLLVLSACQTAAGDKRAALGLAGIAVRSGARSTIASLWPVNDETTAIFMTTFYENLKQPGVSKAEALSLAQRDLLKKYPSPYYWAPFVLVGNWL